MGTGAPCPHAGFRVDGVTIAYAGSAAVTDASFVVAPGEAVAFVGPSGSGKTTLLRALNGTLRTDSGSVQFGDVTLHELSARRLREVRSCIGFVPQDLALVPNLRVVQNVISGRLGRMSFLTSVRAMLRPSEADLAHVYRILERVGIPEKLYERTDRLSGGQQQRVAIARALFQDPKALIADEPVSAVDPARARDTMALLTDISREEGWTLCVSLHNLDLARAFFPRLLALRRGRIVFDRPTADVEMAEFEKLYHLERGEILADGA